MTPVLHNAFALRLLVLPLAFVIISGCGGRKGGGDVIAKAGSRELTKSDLSEMAGRSADSLSKTERWQLMQGWIERSLALQEGERRKLERREDVGRALEMLKADLFAAKLLQEIEAPPPTEAEIQTYYDAHRKEFLRPVDAYLLELYWAEHQNLLAQFRRDLERGDTTMLAAGDVSAEGRWLAEAGELDADFERELSSLQPGEITFPRPYEDGYRIARLVETFPAGTVLDVSVVRDEIIARLQLEQSRKRQDSLQTVLRERFPVTVYLNE